MFYDGPAKSTPGYFCTGTGTGSIGARGTRHLRVGGSAIDAAAATARMSPAQLRGKISTKTVSGSAGTVGGTRVQQNPLVRITVQAPTPRKARIAVNSLARQTVDRLSGYASQKIKLLEERIAADKQRCKAEEGKTSQKWDVCPH